MKLSETILGAIACLIGIGTLITTFSFPKMSDGAPGPGLFPQILSVLMIAFGLIIIYQSFKPHEESGEIHYETINLLKAGSVLVAIAFFVFFVHSLGFLITVTIIMFGLMTILGVRPKVSIPTAILLTLACIGLFEKLLRVPLPPGILKG